MEIVTLLMDRSQIQQTCDVLHFAASPLSRPSLAQNSNDVSHSDRRAVSCAADGLLLEAQKVRL